MPSSHSLTRHPKFAIVKTSSLGDIIHAIPIAQYLKKKFPESSLSWVVEDRFVDLLESVDTIDDVISVSVKQVKKNPLTLFRNLRSVKSQIRKRYDVIFDLQGNTKSGLILLLMKGRKKVGFSASCVSEWPNLLLTNHKVDVDLSSQIGSQYLSFVKQYFGDFSQSLLSPTLLSNQVSKDADSFLKTQTSHLRKNDHGLPWLQLGEQKALRKNSHSAFKPAPVPL